MNSRTFSYISRTVLAYGHGKKQSCDFDCFFPWPCCVWLMAAGTWSWWPLRGYPHSNHLCTTINQLWLRESNTCTRAGKAQSYKCTQTRKKRTGTMFTCWCARVFRRADMNESFKHTEMCGRFMSLSDKLSKTSWTALTRCASRWSASRWRTQASRSCTRRGSARPSQLKSPKIGR